LSDKKKGTKSSKSKGKKVKVEDTFVPTKRRPMDGSSRLRTSRVISAREYLIRIGVKPNHIPALIATAKSNGHTVETVSSWKVIFEKIRS